MRTNIDNKSIPKSLYSTIFKLTQGHGALIKYICKYYYTNQNLDIAQLVKYPPMKLTPPLRMGFPLLANVY